MLIDCDGCQGRGLACADCVVTVLLNGDSSGAPAGGPANGPTSGPAPHVGAVPAVPGSAGVALDAVERMAIRNLAAAGMVPPLRLEPSAAAG